MADKIQFLKGYEKKLPQNITNGSIYFAISDNDEGYNIYLDSNDKRFELDTNQKRYYKIGEEDIKANDLIAFDKEGSMVPAARASFLLGSSLFISAANFSAEDFGEARLFYDNKANVCLKNNGEETNGTPYKHIYLVGTIAEGLFVPIGKDCFVYEIPQIDNNYYYLHIGRVNPYTSLNGNYSYIDFSLNHPLYCFKDGAVQLYGQSNDKQTSLKGTLTVGTIKYDGSQDVEIPVYYGENY